VATRSSTPASTTCARGLIFICFACSISTQFEVITPQLRAGPVRRLLLRTAGDEREPAVDLDPARHSRDVAQRRGPSAPFSIGFARRGRGARRFQHGGRAVTARAFCRVTGPRACAAYATAPSIGKLRRLLLHSRACGTADGQGRARARMWSSSMATRSRSWASCAATSGGARSCNRPAGSPQIRMSSVSERCPLGQLP
jgi:hypothetical protein